jgi:hypothetical protein
LSLRDTFPFPHYTPKKQKPNMNKAPGIHGVSGSTARTR